MFITLHDFPATSHAHDRIQGDRPLVCRPSAYMHIYAPQGTHAPRAAKIKIK